MKIRTSHITNSSSSSYLIVTTPEVHQAAILKLEKWQRRVLKVLNTEKEAFVVTQWGSGETWDSQYFFKNTKISHLKNLDRYALQEEVDATFDQYQRFVKEQKDKNTICATESY